LPARERRRAGCRSGSVVGRPGAGLHGDSGGEREARPQVTVPSPCLMVQGTGSGVGKSLLTAALCRLFVRAGYRVAPFKAQNMALNAAVADGGEIGRAQAVQAEAAGIEPSVDMNPILLKPESDHRSQVVVRRRPVASADRGGVFAALVGTLALLDSADRARVGGLIVNKLRGDHSILAPGLDELVARTGVPVLGVVPWLEERLVAAEDVLDLDAFASGADD